MNASIRDLKNFYDEGYKCIKYEQDENGELVIYLKNFEREKIKTLYCNDSKEIGEIKSFLNIN